MKQLKNTISSILPGIICMFLCLSALGTDFYPSSSSTPLANDLDLNGKELFNIGDIISDGPWVDVRGYTTFANALTAIGSTERTLLISEPCSITSNTTIPSNVTLKFLNGGRLNIDNEAVLTINGTVDAGPYYIFNVIDGQVKFGDLIYQYYCYIPKNNIRDIYAQWFGVKGDNTTDNDQALENMFNSALHGARFVFPSGVFRTTGCDYLSSLDNRSGIQIVGNGNFSTVLRYDGVTNNDGAFFLIKDDLGGFSLSNLRLEIPGLGYGYYVNPASTICAYYVQVRDVFVAGFTKAAFRAGRYSENSVDGNYAFYRFDNVDTRGASGSTDYIVDAPNAIDWNWNNCSQAALDAQNKQASHFDLRYGTGFAVQGGWTGSLTGVTTGTANYVFKVNTDEAGSAALNVTGLSSEDYRLLQTGDNSGCPVVSITGCQVQLHNGPSTTVARCIDAPTGMISLNTVAFDSSFSVPYPREIYVVSLF